jgi:hypothetical protein
MNIDRDASEGVQAGTAGSGNAQSHGIHTNKIARDHDIARTDQGGSEGVTAPTLHRAHKYKSLKLQLQA